MILVVIRALILYTLVLISIRLMGKSELAQMQPYELVITLMIAELAVLPMEDLDAPLIYGIVGICTLLFAQVTISFINMKSDRVRGFICGKPSILIKNGKINEKELRRLRININDLVEQLRSMDYPSMKDVEYAILETNGDLSVIPKPLKRNATVEDVKADTNDEGLPVTLIIDGKINYGNLRKAGLHKKWLDKELKKRKISNTKDILFCYVDCNNQIYIYKKNELKEN